MKKKIIAIGILAFVVLAFMAPQQAHAQKQKLGEAEAKRLFDKLDGYGTSREVENAIKTIIRHMDTNRKGTKAQKAAAALMETNGYYSKMKDIQTLYGIFTSWRIAKDQKNLTKGANATFDTIDFVAGKWGGGAYVKAITSAGRTMLAMANYSAGVQRHFAIVTKVVIIGNERLYRDYPYAFDEEYYDFSRAWFASVYDTKNTDNDDRIILTNIHEYIAAIETLKKAGLLQ